MTALVQHSRHDDPDAIVASLLDSGAVVIDDFLTAEVVAALNDELDPVMAEAPTEREFINPAIADFFGTRVRHLTGIAGRSPLFASEVLCHRLYEAVNEQVLGPNCASWRLNIGHLLERGPGAEQQFIHRDQDVWSFLPTPHPEVQVASIVALSDFTADNGATRLVPGSHRWDDPSRYPADDELVVADMPAGAAILYLGSTYHAGGTNVTADEWRRGFHLSFVVGWLRTEENNVLATPPDVARHLPRRAQELLGYGAHDAIATGGGYLGTLDVRDPVELLASGEL
ncbi:MAG: phytanoyl-CoA dioxygenase family protein [Acidimicrobiia bacterium]|nr:phytanoyl-CoA dioxygenase family protein [Acidimicrobiia bacterium]